MVSIHAQADLVRRYARMLQSTSASRKGAGRSMSELASRALELNRSRAA